MIAVNRYVLYCPKQKRAPDGGIAAYEEQWDT